MKKIIYIFQSNYPWDIRVDKFLRVLSRNCDVNLLCRNTDNKIEYEVDNTFKYKIHRFPKKYSSIKMKSEPIHLNLYWKKFIEDKVKEINPDFIIVRNLPLAKLVIKIGKKYNKKIIFDNAENYPEFIRFFPKYNNILFKALDKINYFENLENYCVKSAFKTINVIEENTVRIAEKIETNKCMIEIYNVPGSMKKLSNEEHEGINLCYIGGLEDDNLRGVSDIIRAIALLNKNYKLYILGDGKEKKYLEELTRLLNVQEKVIFLGNIKYEEITKWVKQFDIGIVSHRKIKMTDTTMANKIYEYMAWNLAVITTDAIPLKRFVEENKIGVIYNSGDVENLKQAIEDISDKKCLQVLKDHNYRLHKDKYNWEVESEKILKIIGEI